MVCILWIIQIGQSVPTEESVIHEVTHEALSKRGSIESDSNVESPAEELPYVIRCECLFPYCSL